MPLCLGTVSRTDPVTGVQSTELVVQVSPPAGVQACHYVVQTGTEYLESQASGFRDLMNISPTDAAQIGTAIGVVWATAWGIRLIGSVLSADEAVEK